MCDRRIARLTLGGVAKGEQGQGLVEYAFLLLLVALAAIGTVTALGTSIDTMVQSVVNAF